MTSFLFTGSLVNEYPFRNNFKYMAMAVSYLRPQPNKHACLFETMLNALLFHKENYEGAPNPVLTYRRMQQGVHSLCAHKLTNEKEP